METTLVLNAGSSSLKFRCYRSTACILDGVVDRIGQKATLAITGSREREVPVRTHREAGLLVLSLLEQAPANVIHRMVHGGAYVRPMVLSAQVLARLRELVPLAPLHLPAELDLVDMFAQRTGARQIACFDTMFHRSMSAAARTYAIPRSLAKKYGIERYGFHGIAHRALAQAFARAQKKPLRSLRIVTCQLGNGASVCAVRAGKSIETSMGFSPLEGLVMGTRSGSIDPAIVAFLCEHEHMRPAQVLDMLERSSGLLALGGSSDVRDLLAKERKKDAAARLALDVFAHRVRMQIGSCIAALGGVDGVVFGGGVIRAPQMRTRILDGLEDLGISLSPQQVRKKAPVCISCGKVPVWVFEVDEQEEMFNLARRMVKAHP